MHFDNLINYQKKIWQLLYICAYIILRLNPTCSDNCDIDGWVLEDRKGIPHPIGSSGWSRPCPTELTFNNYVAFQKWVRPSSGVFHLGHLCHQQAVCLLHIWPSGATQCCKLSLFFSSCFLRTRKSQEWKNPNVKCQRLDWKLDMTAC